MHNLKILDFNSKLYRIFNIIVLKEVIRQNFVTWIYVANYTKMVINVEAVHIELVLK